MPNTSMLTIGQLARDAHVPLDTVRYYERRGLLPLPPRTAAGYRQYSVDTVRRVAFIKRAQALGLTLDEIADLLALRVTQGRACSTVEAQARTAIARLDGQLTEIRRMREALARLADACRDQHPTDECPLLDAIEPEARDETDAHSTG
jgi:DNA-binding transcriptional MerR regulator